MASEVLCKNCGESFRTRERAKFIIQSGDPGRCLICMGENNLIDLGEAIEHRETGQPGDWKKEVNK